MVDYTVPESPSHVTEVHGMEARDDKTEKSHTGLALLPPSEVRRPAQITPTDDTRDAGRRMEIGAPMHVGCQPRRPKRVAKKRGRQTAP